MNIQCPNHPKYTGKTKLGKRNASCNLCNALRKKFENEKFEKHKRERIYTSISTREVKFDFPHLMAEILTLIKFGYQYPCFWNSDSMSTPEERQFYSKAMAEVTRWIKYKSWATESLIALINRTLEEKSGHTIIEQLVEEKQDNNNPIVIKDDIKLQKNKTPWEKIKEL